MRITIWSGSLPSAQLEGYDISSGAQDLIGYEVDLSAADGSARVILDIEPRHLNRNGSLHGGIVAMLLDSASGFAASRKEAADKVGTVVTVSLTTQFLAPGLPGRVVSTARVVGGGRKIVYCDAELTDENEKVLSRSTGVFKLTGVSK